MPSGTIETNLHVGGIYVSYIQGSLNSEPERHGDFSSRDSHTPLGDKKSIRNTVCFGSILDNSNQRKKTLVNEQ